MKLIDLVHQFLRRMQRPTEVSTGKMMFRTTDVNVSGSLVQRGKEGTLSHESK